MSEDIHLTSAPLEDMQRPPRNWSKTLQLIGMCVGVAVIIVGLFLSSFSSAREAARRTQCKGHLSGIAFALHRYHETHMGFPPAYTVDENGQRLHSWRTLILPYLGQEEFYEKLDLSKPWNHPVNAGVFNAKLNAFWCPSSELPQGFTTYLAIVGENACFHPSKPRAISEITDGTSNTIMVIEVPVKQAVHWMSPHDADEQMVLNISPADKLAHKGGVQSALADGSVRFLSETLAPETRRAVISINGKEVVGEF
jgi:hypothetical protein